MYPEALKYNSDSMWIKVEDSVRARTGITDFYQKQITKTVFVELPKEGTAVKKGAPFGSIESSKTISDLLSPVSGKITSVNRSLNTNPGLIDSDPYGKGWMVVIEMAVPEELNSLISAKEYQAYVESKSK